jgi:multimeric flavodoxin WrbA
MKALILDGSQADDLVAVKINAALLSKLQERGWDVEHILLREQKIGNCAGDFYCWIRSPGICNTNDDNRMIAAKIVQSDLLVCLTPVTFGGYSSALKRMVDHQIQNISPFFAKIDGEIHHQHRYKSYPDMLAIGWMETPDTQAEAVFRNLVKRNAVNMFAKTTVCGVVVGDQSEADLAVQTSQWLEAIGRGSSSPVPALPHMDIPLTNAGPTRRAVVLVGSPRTKKSTSASLGGYLMEKLSARGLETQIIQIYTSLNSPNRLRTMLEALDAADLVVLAFPLYVDSLPAPVIALLEKIATHRSGEPSHPRFAAIANCGFPEAAHNATALSICSQFARQNGYEWAGGLALGGGEGLVHGVPLDELDGRAMPLKKSLELAAEALASGSPIPQESQDLLGKPIIPAWVYKFLSGFGWRRQARYYGADKLIKRRPYRLEAR